VVELHVVFCAIVDPVEIGPLDVTDELRVVEPPAGEVLDEAV